MLAKIYCNYWLSKEVGGLRKMDSLVEVILLIIKYLQANVCVGATGTSESFVISFTLTECKGKKGF